MQGAGLLANDEDVVNDLIGYLILLKIGMNDEKNKEVYNIGREIFEEGFKSVTIPLQRKPIPQEVDGV